MRRALANRDVVGHPLFWFLKVVSPNKASNFAQAEMVNHETRYGLCLEAFLRGCGEMYLETLAAQVNRLMFLLLSTTD